MCYYFEAPELTDRCSPFPSEAVMKIKTLPIALALLTFSMNPVVIMAQQGATSAREWAAVKAVPSGEKLRVRMKDGKTLEGRLRNISDAMLEMDRKNKTIDLNRDSIAKVYRLVKQSTGKSIAKSTAIGAGIGFGIGAGVGIWGGTYEDLETAGLVAILGTGGAAIGAGIGAIVGALGSKQRQVLVYEWK
jgi:hypothetical protein